MAKKRSTDIRLAANDIQSMVYLVRGQRVMFDFDLARLYGVTTTRLNEQVARNRERFPADFAYHLTQQEVANMMSQNAISRSWRFKYGNTLKYNHRDRWSRLYN